MPPQPGLRFPYLPSVLPLIWPLAFLPFWLSWVLFLTVSMAAVFYIIFRLTNAAIAIGAIFAIGGPIHAIQLGQNGFYTAAFLGGGLLALRHSKVLAGVGLGLLTLKPHLAVVAFLALIWWREWKALAFATGTALSLLLLPFALFGPGIYVDFLSGSSSFIESVTLKRETLFEMMHQSVFALMLRETTLPIAMLAHVVVACMGLLVAATIKRRDIAISAVISATLLFSPYSLLYNSTMLVISSALLIRRCKKLTFVLACLIGLTGLWFFTLGSVVPVAAISMLVIAKLLDIRIEDGILSGRFARGNSHDEAIAGRADCN